MSNTLFTKVMALHYQGDDLLEQGVMAEFDGKPDPKLFVAALKRFEETQQQMTVLDKKLGELITIHKQGKATPEFEVALRKILVQSRGPERVSLMWLRYSNVARQGIAPPPTDVVDLLTTMEAQRADLAVLRRQLADTIQAFQAVIPYAEKGEFATMMLSGRHGFAEKIQQSVDLLGVYGRFYTSKCMATIAATMQAYPAGLSWLKDPERRQ